MARYEDSPADRADDKRMAKKRGMSLKEWEDSPEDAKRDAAEQAKLDGKGDAGANNVTVSVAGGGTLHGTAVISSNYGAATFLKTAATVWQRVA